MYISKQNINNNIDPIILDNCKINYSKCIKFLGLYIDEHLNWNIHITKIKEKILPYVGILSKIRYYFSLKQVPIGINQVNRYQFITALFIYLRLQYSASIWWKAHECHLNQLKKLQNKAIKFIFRLSQKLKLIYTFL